MKEKINKMESKKIHNKKSKDLEKTTICSIKGSIKNFFKDKYNICFLVILLIAILSRVLFLEQYPAGLHEDEAGMMYDAYCMAEYGTDRYLNENPVYLINFGGGQSALYAGIASILIKIFGLSVFVVRLPAVIFSALTIILAYMLCKKYIGKKFALILAFLITICPWHIMQSRWGLDCNLLASFIMISVYTLINSKKDWHYLISGVFWGITLYSYALSYIMLPVFFIALCVYLLYTKKITFKQIVITIIPIFLLAIPLILVQIVNMFNKGTMKIGFFTVPQLYTYRISEIGLSNILYNLNIFNGNNFWQLLFSSDHNMFNCLKEFGTIYYVLIPFCIFGFILTIKESIESVKKKSFNVKTVFLIQFISITLCVLVFSDLQLYKLNPLFIMLLVFATEAIVWIYDKKHVIGYVIIAILIISFIIFEIFYFNNINDKLGVAFNKDFIPLVNYLEEKYPEKEIFMETDAIQQYIYLLLTKKMSPYEFIENMEMIQYIGGETEVVRVGRYRFITCKINKDTVYVLEENNAFRSKNVEKIKEILEENGFKLEKYNNFLIYTY